MGATSKRAAGLNTAANTQQYCYYMLAHVEVHSDLCPNHGLLLSNNLTWASTIPVSLSLPGATMPGLHCHGLKESVWLFCYTCERLMTRQLFRHPTETNRHDRGPRPNAGSTWARVDHPTCEHLIRPASRRTESPPASGLGFPNYLIEASSMSFLAHSSRPRSPPSFSVQLSTPNFAWGLSFGVQGLCWQLSDSRQAPQAMFRTGQATWWWTWGCAPLGFEGFWRFWFLIRFFSELWCVYGL